MYAIALMIDTEILIPFVLSSNDCAFNHSYIYIVIFYFFHNINLKLYVLVVLTGNSCVPYHAYIYTVNYLVCYTVLL